MIIPENIIYHNIRSILAYVKKDYEEHTDETKTILYSLFKEDDNGMEMQFNRFNYLEQAKSLFVSSPQATKSRNFLVTMGYNTQRNGLPTIHILLPNESKFEVGIGMGAGYMDDEVCEEENTVKEVFTNVQKATYSLMITSDNSSEVVLMYHALKSMMFATFTAFAHRGLRDLEFGGQDIQFNNELVPPEVFHRNLTLTFFYESSVASFVAEKLVENMLFCGTPLKNELDIEEEED